MYPSICIYIYIRYASSNESSRGWWFQPLWKIWKSNGIIVPNTWKVIKFMFQTTNQSLYRQNAGSSINGATPTSSIFIGFSLLNYPAIGVPALVESLTLTGSMVLVYMLTAANMTGVYWWDPWHTIYSSTVRIRHGSCGTPWYPPGTGHLRSIMPHAVIRSIVKGDHRSVPEGTDLSNDGRGFFGAPFGNREPWGKSGGHPKWPICDFGFDLLYI